MTGTPSTEHGDPAGSEKGAKDEERGFPWQLVVSVVAWVLLGGLLVGSALGVTSTTSEADQGSIDAVQGSLGTSAAAVSGAKGQYPTVTLVLGLATLLMALMLLVGQGWARHLLSLLGVAAVVVFALGGRWEAVASFGLLIIGAVLLLNRRVLRYLSS